MITTANLRNQLIAAVPVPFGDDGTLCHDAHERYVAYMAGQPVAGVAVWAHTGRGLRLTAEQRAAVLTAWRQGLATGQIVIAAAGAEPGERHPDSVIESARKMARHAAGLGADALLVHPPVALRGLADQDRLILQYHAAVGEAGLPLILFFLYEAAGGITYSPLVLTQLLARPEVLGIKVATLDSVMRFQQVAKIVHQHAPEKLLITGEDRFLGYSLMCGANAALIGMAAACTGLQAEFLRSYWTGQSARFLELNGPIDDFAQHTFIAPMEGYIRRMLWCLVHQGIIPAEAAHDRWGPPLGREEFDQIGECLARIGQL